MAEIFVTLLHHPVLDRRGRIVTTAITSLDLHDLARAARTFGVRAVYVAHPVAELRAFALRVRDHWLEGHGRRFDSRRREALQLLEVVADLDQAMAAIEHLTGYRPLLVHTSASAVGGVSCQELRRRMNSEPAPILLMFGTGFGLAPEIRERADLTLEPIEGASGYNHLSVRAAAAIILDRLRRH